MQADYEQQYHDLEDEHFWFVTRRDCLTRLVRMLDTPHDAQVLDIGCASGQMLSKLKALDYGKLTGIDISQEAIGRCRARGFDQTYVMDGGDPKFPPASFDLILASDVLEHIENDQATLSNWFKLLKPGGRLIVFVPAFESLWTDHDEINRHYRRYRRRQLVGRLNASGFVVTRSGYWNSMLFPVVAMSRLIKRASKKPKPRAWLTGEATEFQSSDLKMSPVLNPLLTGLLTLENRALQLGINAPIGISTFAIARRA